MKNLRKRVFPLVPVLALFLSLAISAIKAKTAAMLSPCEEQQMAQSAGQKSNESEGVAAQGQKTSNIFHLSIKLARAEQSAKAALQRCFSCAAESTRQQVYRVQALACWLRRQQPRGRTLYACCATTLVRTGFVSHANYLLFSLTRNADRNRKEISPDQKAA